MATKTKSGSGGMFGVLIALLIVGGVAASPFYLGFLRSDERALSDAVAGKIESIRRDVLALDPSLAMVKDASESGLAEAKPSAAQIQRASSAAGLFSQETLNSLEQTARVLREAYSHDTKDRGFASTIGSKIGTGSPNPQVALGDLDKKYFDAMQKALRRAESMANELRSMNRGAASANNHLASNQVRAVLDFTRAEVLRNKGDLYAGRAALLRSDVRQRLVELARLRGMRDSLGAQKPAAAIAELEKESAQATAQLEQLKKASGQLAGLVEARQAELKEAEDAAAESQARMDQLQASGLTPASAPEYEKASMQNREAEARVAALKNGTLSGGAKAVRSDDASAPLAYEGGTPEMGLRDVERRLAQARSLIALTEATGKTLAARLEAMKKLSGETEEQERELGERLTNLGSSLANTLDDSDAQMNKARTSWDEAIKLYSSAAKLGGSAAQSAAARSRAATQEQATAGAGPAGELCKRITSDGDLEGSMQCLVAECAYRSALLRTQMIDGALEINALRARIASSGGETSEAADAGTDKLKTDALADLANALKAYTTAASLIGRTNATFADGSINGKNYLWQVQVGRAAVHLLQAHLLEGSDEERAAQQAEAYKALAEAAKGREQSPLVAPAIDTLEYLQKSVR